MRPKSSCSSCRINKKKCVFVFPNSCERCVKYHLSCDRSFQSRSSRKNDQNIEDEDEKEISSDCKVAAKSNDSKFLIQDILKKERNEDEKETSSDCKVAAKSNDSKFLSQENSKKDNNKDEKETLSDCKVAAKSNDSELTGPEDHNKDTMELQERLSYISPHHEHQGLDLKFDTVSSVNEDNVDRTVTFYSRGQRKLFHIGSSATLIEELVTSRIKMSYDGPVSFLQCTSLPFNRTKLNGAFLVFRKKHAQAWRLGFVTKFGYDANAADAHKVSLYEWVGRVSICGEPDLFHCKSWNDMLSHLTLVTYSVDDLNGYFVNQVRGITPLATKLSDRTRNKLDSCIQCLSSPDTLPQKIIVGDASIITNDVSILLPSVVGHPDYFVYNKNFKKRNQLTKRQKKHTTFLKMQVSGLCLEGRFHQNSALL